MHNPLKLDYLVTLDWETYHDSSYSLRNLTYIEYIRSPLFKAHGVSIQINDSKPIWYSTKLTIEKALFDIPWNKAGLIGHNLHFDGSVLAFRYDIIPKTYIDTISMARGALPTIKSYALKYLADYLNLGIKDSTALVEIKGVRDPTKENLKKLGIYCCDDVTLAWKLYNTLAKYIPINEYKLMDITTKMQTEPKLMLDKPALVTLVESKLQEREDVLSDAEVTISEVRSSAKLGEKFRGLGIEPPTKTSPATGKQTYAFAKTDLGMQKLLNDPNIKVAKLAKARLTCMSSLDIKRAERFISIHDCNNGVVPVPLNYYGAHTGRWSGGDKINFQNLSKKSGLRHCIIAPPGYLILAADQSQIEARITAWLADHIRLLRDFKLKDEGISPYDVYEIMSSHIYPGTPIDQIDEDQRFIGKMCILGLGYGMGHVTLHTQLNQILGAGSVKEFEAKQWVDIYRDLNKPIVDLWDDMSEVLLNMVHGRDGTLKVIAYDQSSVHLPNGMFLQYPFLTQVPNKWGGIGYEYTYKDKPQNIYGGRLTENIVQALARIKIAEDMIKISNHYQISTMSHDEIICVIRKSEIDEAKEIITEVMSTPPEWGLDIPLALEIKIDDKYIK